MASPEDVLSNFVHGENPRVKRAKIELTLLITSWNSYNEYNRSPRYILLDGGTW